MNLVLHLQIAGILQWLLASLHLVFPRRFGWREDLAKLSLLNRQIFIVHCIFICLVLSLFGGLSLFCAPLLLAKHALAAAVLSGLFVFWAVRLFVQWFVYSPELWRGHRFNTIMHWLFTGLWLYYVAVYGAALWRQIQ